MNAQEMFERELRRRGIDFKLDPTSARHAVQIENASMLVSLENLKRDMERDGDASRISRFVDAIVASRTAGDTLAPELLYWNIEPNNYLEKADFRVPLSDKVDRVLVYLSPDGKLITWATPSMLQKLVLTETEASNIAYVNLSRALREANLSHEDMDGAYLGMLASKLPIKAALILAPNINEVLGAKLGWPLMAVLPDRDFLFLWAAKHTEFVGRVGPVVVREYERASYPISTEVFEISDAGIRAIGEFPTRSIQSE